MRDFIFILIAIFACIVQSTLVQFISIGRAVPDLILIVICYVGLFHGKKAMWYGFGTGLFVDLYTIRGFGYNILVKTAIGWLLGYFSNYLYKKKILAQSIILLLAVWIQDLIIAIPKGQFYFRTFYGRIFPSSIYTVAIGIPLFFLFRRIDREGE
ncbi:rod shape-determining protein MreD [candidate division WOR-3 bacterium JGI_Cruoil_03_44_89]|uniref:Rod shape-determining protein MreD n=1 Tax=candidate division WOR-3 bacterium JGI_Cruoil_03_44_89 TaxID=1973748 RepID=A0A235BZG4_UNCW3|nr:MAG: rod shape-determining protein MreD [candidate division WOR-3 bacterium JGI_Cruoil_03_44_89]